MRHPFHWLDQFQDIEIDLIPYQEYMKKFDPDFKFSNIQPVRTTLKNIFLQTQIINNYLKNKLLFIQYSVKDGESITYVSKKFYGYPEYWWIIAVFNNIKNPFNDWIFTNDQLYMIAKYLYENEGEYTYEVYFNLLFEYNEKRRKIVVLKPSEVENLVLDFIESLTSVETA